MATIERDTKRRKVDEEEDQEMETIDDMVVEGQEGEGQEGEEGEGEGEGEVMQRGHPYGVETMGNWLVRGGANKRDTGLGNLACLQDELIVEIMRYLTPQDLKNVAIVSQAFYVFSSIDDLWKEAVLFDFGGNFSFSKTWKHTYKMKKREEFVKEGGKKIEDNGECFQVSGFYSDHLYQMWCCGNMEIPNFWIKNDNIDRRSNLSLEQFIEEYRIPNKPVIVTDIVTKWPAYKKWTEDYLHNICGEKNLSADYDTNNSKCAASINFSYKNYKTYAQNNHDELPLYIFDHLFADTFPDLRSDYSVPSYFEEDLFSVLGDKRPHYRWLLLGPCRSGSSFHIDPNATSAWNALLEGRKKWVLFPPGCTPPGVHTDGGVTVCPVSVMEWFKNYYKEARTHETKPIECILERGEIIYVPGGWWHMVLNLDFTVSVTQNFVDSANLSNVLSFLESKEEDIVGVDDQKLLYPDFCKQMEEKHPELLQKAREEKKEKEERKKKANAWDEKVNNESSAGFSLMSFF